jgi:beta-glucosidase
LFRPLYGRLGLLGPYNKLQSVYKICPILVSQIEMTMPFRNAHKLFARLLHSLFVLPLHSLSALLLSLALGLPASAQLPFRDASLPAADRVNDLLSRLTLEEKVSLLGYRSKSVDRLGIPAYNWWNEGLHGVARAGEATVFPQAIAMAASFDNTLLHSAADAISTEARAKYNLSTAAGRSEQYMGLTFWSPNINIFRDPRWGRGQETYGEDPFLTATMGTAYVTGLQGNDPHYLKASACAKHFAVHSGPEADRHTFDAIVDEKDLRETYLYAFKRLVDSGVESVMCAYNRVNGEPCCSGPTLLHRILRDEWHFRGHVVTDCGALDDIFERHKTLPGPVETAAAAIKAGVDLDCSSVLQQDVLKAVQAGLLTPQQVDSALAPLIRTQLKLGFFDTKADVSFSSYGADSVRNAYHVYLARSMAAESIVLLQNENNALPLHTASLGSLMVVGPNAFSFDALAGNYHGVSSRMVTFLEGITAIAGPAVHVEYDQGCDYKDSVHFGGTWAASNCQATIAVIGLTPVMEGEEGDAFLAPHGGDRADLSLPAAHIAYIKALRKAIGHKPLIVVVTAGSAVDLTPIAPYADAILLAWYPGEEGGNALADILFGKTSPSGRLPVTFYRHTGDLPAYKDYSMKGRTYRYYDGPVQYPFGFGLSYTSFSYDWEQPIGKQYGAKDSIRVLATIANSGTMDGAEVAQAYLQYPSGDRMPLKELKAFRRLWIPAGQSRQLQLSIPVRELQKWDLATGKWKLYPGKYRIILGSHSRDEKLTATFEVKPTT